MAVGISLCEDLPVMLSTPRRLVMTVVYCLQSGRRSLYGTVQSIPLCAS